MNKKIIIFTSSGGNGHVSAMRAIQACLEDEYTVKPVFIFEEVFKNVDPIAIISWGHFTGENLYNFFLRRKWYKILNLFYRIGYRYFSWREQTITHILEAYLAQEKPAVIISVVPIINGAIMQAAHHNKIPFLLVPTDLDVYTFVRGIKHPAYKNFHMTLGFNDPILWKSVQQFSINPTSVTVAGLPLRKEFFEPKDPVALKQEFGIPNGKPVILLIMGGQGNTSIATFTQQLAALTIPAHLIICVGKDESVKKQLAKITVNPGISYTILGFTQRISDLLAISDLLITKSGSVSFWEGISMEVPMILDSTCTLLYWECLNHTLLKKNNLGICLENTDDLKGIVTMLLADTNKYAQIKKNLTALDKKRLDLAIKPLLYDLMSRTD